MAVFRVSSCRSGKIGDQNAPWHMFGDKAPGVLEDDARMGLMFERVERQTGATPLTIQPIFDENSGLGRHILGLPDAALGEPGEPIVVFVHGFQFEARENKPSRLNSQNPHRRLFHFDEVHDEEADEHDSHVTPWLARTFFQSGTGVEDDCKGLGVCFGYSSFGDTAEEGSSGWWATLTSVFDFVNPRGRPQNFYALAYDDAKLAGHGLAATLVHLAARLDAAGRGGEKIHIVCHSLGTRTVMKALEVLAWRYPMDDRALERVGRVLLLAGACLWEQAATTLRRIMEADPTHLPQFFNMLSTSDEINTVLGARGALRIAREEADLDRDAAARLGTFARGGEVLGIEGRPDDALYAPNGRAYVDWVDVNLASEAVMAWGAGQQMSLKGKLPNLAKDHWVHYTHRENWTFYRRILRGEPGFSAVELAAAVPGQRTPFAPV